MLGDSNVGQLGQETTFPIGDNQGEMNTLNAISLGIDAPIRQLEAGAAIPVHSLRPARSSAGDRMIWGSWFARGGASRR